jgi:hypothetical protein
MGIAETFTVYMNHVTEDDIFSMSETTFHEYHSIIFWVKAPLSVLLCRRSVVVLLADPDLLVHGKPGRLPHGGPDGGAHQLS